MWGACRVCRIVVMRMRRGRIVCLTLLVLAVAAGACIVKNRTWLGAVAAESVLSALLGGAEVDVAEVAVIDGRQLKLKGVTIEAGDGGKACAEGRQGGHGGRGAHGGISVDTVAITYDLADFISGRVDPLASVVRVDLHGFRGHEDQLYALGRRLADAGVEASVASTEAGGSDGARADAGAGPAAPKKQPKNVGARGGSSYLAGWNAPIGLYDCVIVTHRFGPVAVRSAELALDQARSGEGGFILAVDTASIAASQWQLEGAVQLRLPLGLESLAAADVRFDVAGGGGLTVQGALKLSESSDDRLDMRITGPEGHAELGFVGELDARLKGGRPLVQAGGDVEVSSLKWDSIELEDWKLRADVRYDGESGLARLDGGKTGLDRILDAARPLLPESGAGASAEMVRGWLDWRAQLKVDASGLAGELQLADGELEVEGVEGTFSKVRGSLKFDGGAAAAQAGHEPDPTIALGSATLQADFGGGSVRVEGAGDCWSLEAGQVSLSHQLLNAVVDASLSYAQGSVAGAITVGDGTIDAVTAGFSSVPTIPDIAVDVTLRAGEALTVERGETWAEVMPGSEVRVAGSLRNPTFEGQVGLGEGQIAVSGQTLRVLGGQATMEPGAAPRFALTIVESLGGDDVLVTAFGELGDIQLELAKAAGQDGQPAGDFSAQGDLLAKLIGSRVRQYVLDQLASWIDSMPWNIGRN